VLKKVEFIYVGIAMPKEKRNPVRKIAVTICLFGIMVLNIILELKNP